MGGGAWKVAYADFVTAMMALFMVLWILGNEQETLDQLQEYFRNPPSPWEENFNKFIVETGEFQGFSMDRDGAERSFNATDPSVLKGIMDTFHQMLKNNHEMEKMPPVEMDLTADELRMVLFDREDMSLFRGDSTSLTTWGDFMIQNIAWLIGHYDLQVTIESHTHPLYEGNKRDYGPWELTSDRANKVRRSLAFYADGEISVKRVVGYGAVQPLEEGDDFLKPDERTIISLSMPPSVDAEHYEIKRQIEEQRLQSVQPLDLLQLDALQQENNAPTSE